MATLERRANFWRVKIRRASLPARPEPSIPKRSPSAGPAVSKRRWTKGSPSIGASRIELLWRKSSNATGVK
jgi:hypothetical protein